MQVLVNGFNVGTELVALSINWNGNTVSCEQLGHLEALNNVTQENTEITVSPVGYGGIRFHRNIYHDWMFSLDFDRFNNNVTSLVQGVMTNFQQTGAETYFNVIGHYSEYRCWLRRRVVI